MTKEELFQKVTKGKLCTLEKDYIPTKKQAKPKLQGTVIPVNPNTRVIKRGK
jgi:hypothetical protein